MLDHHQLCLCLLGDFIHGDIFLAFVVLNLFKVISRRVEDVRRHRGRLARGHDIDGGNPYASAKGAGHSKETKARYYKKVSYEEAQESYATKSAFVEGW